MILKLRHNDRLKNILCFPYLGQNQKSAPCEDRTHNFQISKLDYKTDALKLSMVFISDK